MLVRLLVRDGTGTKNRNNIICLFSFYVSDKRTIPEQKREQCFGACIQVSGVRLSRLDLVQASAEARIGVVEFLRQIG